MCLNNHQQYQQVESQQVIFLFAKFNLSSDTLIFFKFFKDAPTNDQYLAFDDEGAGSMAGSLSSIDEDFDRNAGGFDNLQQYGQKFSNLNNLYNPPDSDNYENTNQFRNRGNEYQNSFLNSPQNLQFRN